jgi:hypothetical protein
MGLARRPDAGQSAAASVCGRSIAWRNPARVNRFDAEKMGMLEHKRQIKRAI